MRPNDIPMALALIVGTLHCALGPVQAGPVHNNEPAHVDPIPGTKLNRVVLEPKALERLGIETTEVQDTTAARKRLVAADLVEIDEARRLGLDASPSDQPATGTDEPRTTWVRVSPGGDLSKVSVRQPAFIKPLHRTDTFTSLAAEPVPAPEGPKARDGAEVLYYRVDGHDAVLRSKRRVLLELPYSAARRKAVPFSAVFHDERGEAWVYVSPEPRVFVRHPVRVDYVSGDVAFLLEGPAPGAQVVKVGASMLYGTEFKVGH